MVITKISHSLPPLLGVDAWYLLVAAWVAVALIVACLISGSFPRLLKTLNSSFFRLFRSLKRNRYRRPNVHRMSCSDKWVQYLHQNVAHYALLSLQEQSKLREDLQVFISQKNWEGCGGLQMTDEIMVTIAAQACLLVLGMEHHYYDRVQSILVYPNAFLVPHAAVGGSGLVLTGSRPVVGQAWYRGPVILSWQEVLLDGRHVGRGKNVVFHEFAHQLDMEDGLVDGTPPLQNPEQYQKWHHVMTAEYEQLIAEAKERRAHLLDEYGATDAGEFFAVATECFFDQPLELAHRHPNLYQLLQEYYRQDPAVRWAQHQDSPNSCRRTS